jgi:UDP-glucose 4-epimerase
MKGEKKPRFIFISSCAVYGHSEITKEDVQPAPISLNGIAKLWNERLIAEYCGHHGIDYTIVRAFNTFGGRDRFSIIHRLLQSLESKTPFVLYNKGLSQRDFVHVDDVAAIILKLVQKPTREKILNLGSGEAVKIKDIVNEFRRLHPQLEVVHQIRDEAEYSRANISRLREVVPDYEFRGVLDFIRGGL